MQVREILNQLHLGKSVADADSRLQRYFVDTYAFNVLVSGQRDIIAGDKGTGKTALYKILISRHRQIEALRATEIVPAFNLAGSPVFQQLLTVPEQTEGQYIAFWKTYILTLIGNWIVDNPSIVKQVSLQRVEYFLTKNNLKTADISPGGIFSRLLARFPKIPIPRSVEMEVGFSETGQPVLKPRIEFSPPAAVQPTNFFGIDYLAGLKLLEASLQESNLTIWIALDRLDEAFLGYPGVEVPALRALLRTYLDFNAAKHIRLKLFLRKDLFRKVTADGFVNLTHINDQKTEIHWDDEDLLNLLIVRIKDNPVVTEVLGLERLSNEAAFYKIFPAKIAQGEKQSVTWRWILSRIRDGNGVVAPRNLVDFMENCREAQLRSELRNPREYADGISLIEADAVRKAHRTLTARGAMGRISAWSCV